MTLKTTLFQKNLKSANGLEELIDEHDYVLKSAEKHL
jgi:hypothetical protein